MLDGCALPSKMHNFIEDLRENFVDHLKDLNQLINPLFGSQHGVPVGVLTEKLGFIFCSYKLVRVLVIWTAISNY